MRALIALAQALCRKPCSSSMAMQQMLLVTVGDRLTVGAVEKQPSPVSEARARWEATWKRQLESQTWLQQ